MSMFERIKNVWANLKFPDYAGLETPTGVESLNTSELLEKIIEKCFADQVSLDRRLLAPWAEEFQHQLLILNLTCIAQSP